MMDANLINKKMAIKLWPSIRDKVEKACEYSGGIVTPLTIYKGILSNDMQLWVTDDMNMIAVTQISNYDDGSKYLTWVLLSGDNLKEYMSLKNIIDDWAVSHGCQGDELLGRPGWSKILNGYKEIYRFLRQEYGSQTTH